MKKAKRKEKEREEGRRKEGLEEKEGLDGRVDGSRDSNKCQEATTLLPRMKTRENRGWNLEWGEDGGGSLNPWRGPEVKIHRGIRS